MGLKKFLINLFLWTTLVVLVTFAVFGSFFVWKINQTEKKIDADQSIQSSVFDTFKNIASLDSNDLKGAKSGRINVLLLGIAGNEKRGENLTDTIIVASINTKTNQVALLSVPRDLYVEIPGANFKTKINAVYQYGLSLYPNNAVRAMEPILDTVKNITSLEINYWAILNFDGFQKAIDAIGGINVMNERDIYDPRYPGPGFSYETFELKKGFQHLDGATALKYARMRHNDPEGDFGRAKRQQQVLQATKNKIFGATTLFDAAAINKLLDIIGTNIKTDLDPGELNDFLKLAKKLDTDNINNVVLDAWNSDSLLKVSHVFYGDLPAFVLVPRVGNWSETQELAENIFNTNTIKRRRQEISQENARLSIINRSGDNLIFGRIIKLLRDSFGYKNLISLYPQDKKTQDKSVVYDTTGGTKPFTLDELAKKLPAAVSYSLGSNNENMIANIQPDLVVVVGKDLISHYDMAEDSFSDYNKASDTNEYLEFRK
jgi:polyisoprenyl-teichoic acid--peptidoglycan teichoic acid transferase